MDKVSIMMDIKDTTGQGSTQYEVFFDNNNEDRNLKRKTQLLGTEQLCVLRTEPETDIIFAKPNLKCLSWQCPYCKVNSLTVHRKNVKHEYWTVGTDKNLHRVVLLRNYCRCNNADCDSKKEGTKEKAVFPQRFHAPESNTPHNNDETYIIYNGNQNKIFDVVAGRTSYGIKLIDEIGRQSLINTFSSLSESLQTVDGTAPLSKSMVALAFRLWKSYRDNYRIRMIRHTSYEKIWIQTLTVNRHQGEEQSYVVFDLTSKTVLWIAQKKQANEPASDSDIIEFFEKIGGEPFANATFYIGLDSDLKNIIKRYYPKSKIIVPADYVLLAAGETIATIVHTLVNDETIAVKRLLKNISTKTKSSPEGISKKRNIGFLTDNQLSKIKQLWTTLYSEYPSESHEYFCIVEAETLYKLKENLAAKWYNGSRNDAHVEFDVMMLYISSPNRLDNLCSELAMQLSEFKDEIRASFAEDKRVDDPTTLSELEYMGNYLRKTYGCSFDATTARILYCAEIDDMREQLTDNSQTFITNEEKPDDFVFNYSQSYNSIDTDIKPIKTTINKTRHFTLSDAIKRLEKLDSDKKKEKKAKKNGQ